MGNSVTQWNITTTGLKVGGKLWSAGAGWVIIARLDRKSVWVRPDTMKENHV